MESKDYEPRAYGKITKFEAGCFYRSMKEGSIEVLPELIKRMYDEANEPWMAWQIKESYQQNSLYYDRIYDATRAILDGDFSKAQEEISNIQNSLIKLAGKKSSFYHYRKEMNIED